MYSTAELPDFFEAAVDGDDSALTDMNNAPLAGFGYGLCISRLYARCVQGYFVSTDSNRLGLTAFPDLPGILAGSCPWNALMDMGPMRMFIFRHSLTRPLRFYPRLWLLK